MPSALSDLFFAPLFHSCGLLLRPLCPDKLDMIHADMITERLQSEQPGVTVIACHVPAHLGWSANNNAASPRQSVCFEVVSYQVGFKKTFLGGGGL